MKPIFTLLLLIAVYCLHAQDLTQTIRGTVVDKHSQYPLPGASVVLLSLDNESTATNVEGEFVFTDVPVGRHALEITFLGYEPVFIRNVELTSAKELILNVEMQESFQELAEVKIVAEEKKSEAKNKTATVSARQFTLEETSRYAGSLNDPARMASNYAGVVGTGDQRNDIIIRGNSPTGLLWRMDGINIPNPNHFGVLGTTGGPVSILNNNLLANSDFMTGAFPSEYGNAIAGAFDLKMRTGNSSKREYWGQIGFNGFELGAEGPISKEGNGSYLASYRYSTLGVFDAMGISFGVPAVPQYQDLSFKIDLPTGLKYGRFSIFGIGGLSYIDLLDSEKSEDEWSFTEGGTDTYFDSDMGVIGLNHLMYISEKTNLKSAIALSGTRNTIQQIQLVTNGDNYQNYGNRSQNITTSITSQLNHKFNNRNFLRAGFIVDRYNVAYSDSFLVNETWLNNYDLADQMALVQTYANYQFRANENITINLGLHQQLFNLNNKNAIEPRAGVQWQIADKHLLSFGYGMHSQLQPFQVYLKQTYIDTISSDYYLSNENLGFSKSNHYVLGYDFNISANWRIKAETYYQDVYDIPIEQNPSYFSMSNIGADFGIPLIDSLVNEGTGENYGVELTIEKFFSKNYYFLVTGSLFESKYTGSDGVQRNTAFNGNYALNVLGGFEKRLGKSLTLTFSAKAARIGGRRYIPIDLQASNEAGEAVYDMTEIYTQKHPDWFRIDAKLMLRQELKKVTQQWGIDVQNILGTQNVFQQVYDPASQSIKTEYQLGFFPVGLYKIMF